MGRNGKLSNVYLAVVFAILYAPIAYLIFYSFNSGGHMRSFEGFTLEWVQRGVRRYTAAHHCAEYIYHCAAVISHFDNPWCCPGALAIYHVRRKRTKNTLLSLQ